MQIAVDTSVIIAIITNEAHKRQLVETAKGADLIAPSSLHWEIGNAFSAMFRRKRITFEQAVAALAAYIQIPIRFFDCSLNHSLELSYKLDIFAYDAYFIACAIENNSALVSLDSRLLNAAEKIGVKIIEVTP